MQPRYYFIDSLARPTFTPSPTISPTTTQSPTPTPTSEPIDLIQVYFPPEEWETAYCIRWRESRNDTTQVSETDDWGWFQIHRGPIQNPDGTWWEGWEAYFLREWKEWNPLDPEWNTKAALHIWERGGGWFAWSTYDGSC